MAEYVAPKDAVEYVERSIEGFLTDPPDCDFQKGYLSALITVYVEAMGKPKDTPLIEAAEEVMKVGA